MSWGITWSEALHVDLDIAGPELFERAGDAVRCFADQAPLEKAGQPSAAPADSLT